MLTQCGYTVFMDQFVLVAGQGLSSQLGKNLGSSASGVLIWSQKAADSKWVESEFDTMYARKNNSANEKFPFYFVMASLDGQQPHGLQDGQIYLDFSEYPDGPTGADLVKLTCGLQGKPLSEEAVRGVAAFESSIREEPAKLRAMAEARLFDRILKSIQSEDQAYTTSATLPGIAIELLISGKQVKEAIEATKFALNRFPNSVRLRQLQGLAFRRDGQLDEAAYKLNLLLEQGHRDTETLGILAAVWADLWEKLKESNDASGARDALEKSRNLYEEGFEKVPTDTYTGINAASKSALLGEMDKAHTFAGNVLDQLKKWKASGTGSRLPIIGSVLPKPRRS